MTGGCAKCQIAGIVGSAIYGRGKLVVSLVQKKVTETVVGKQPYGRFIDLRFYERRARGRELQRVKERVDCPARQDTDPPPLCALDFTD